MATTLGLYEDMGARDGAIACVVADGGIRLVNPSPYGGMWAARWLNAARAPVLQACGVVLPAHVTPLATVTNNLTEAVALLVALEYLPDGWSGEARSDSLNAIRLFRDRPKPTPRDWLTADLAERIARVRARLGRVSFTLLAGHPSKKVRARLAAGEDVRNPSGHPYCLHNHWADEACRAAWHAHEAELERLKT